MAAHTNPAKCAAFIASITSWLVATCVATAAAPADFLITGTSVGLVRLGATKKDIRRAYSHKRVIEVDVLLESEAKSHAVQIQDGKDILISAEISEHGEAWRLTTQQPAFKTSGGVGVGSTFVDLIRAHGKPSSFDFPEGAIFAVYVFPGGTVGFQLNKGFDAALFKKKEPPTTAIVVRVVVTNRG